MIFCSFLLFARKRYFSCCFAGMPAFNCYAVNTSGKRAGIQCNFAIRADSSSTGFADNASAARIAQRNSVCITCRKIDE
jgi:hypothetical protein